MLNKTKITLIFILFVLCPVHHYAYAQNLRIHLIDAGEGDAILIETAEGKTALIDAGNLITGFHLSEYLKKRNIRVLDQVIFTHAHLDHIGGAFFILQMFDVNNIYDNGQELTEPLDYFDIYRWYEILARRNKNYKPLKAKDVISLGEVNLRVLWPDEMDISSDFNNSSLVIMLEYGEFRCLLTADITSFAERKILEENSNIKADVLKVAHHGADDSSCNEFLNAVSPRIALISVNKENINGYPAVEALYRLKMAKIQVYRTDKFGDIVLSVNKNKEIDVRTGKDLDKK